MLMHRNDPVVSRPSTPQRFTGKTGGDGHTDHRVAGAERVGAFVRGAFVFSHVHSCVTVVSYLGAVVCL